MLDPGHARCVQIPKRPLLAFLTVPVLLLAGIVPAASAQQRAPAAAAYEARFDWPLRPAPSVVRPFEPADDPYGAGHRGVDLTARQGQPVYAAGSGVVIFAGNLAGRGVVSIDHDALRTTYEPLNPVVTAGEQVHAGQLIGAVTTGHVGCDGACLHWGVRRGSDPPEYLDPLALVEYSRIRLKPWRDA